MGGPERKVITVLFADVVGSTALGGSLDPEQLSTILRDYFDAMRRAIAAHGGVVEKFIGDAVVAVFGIPTTREDDAARTLRCALAMQRALVGVNERLQLHHGVALVMRIGVNTGEVITEGDQLPGEPFVTGDAMNVAARLQALAEPGRIVVSRRSARAARVARGTFVFRSLGAVTMRGRSETIEVFELSAEVPVRGDGGEGGDGGLLGPAMARAPLLGREAALGRLGDALEPFRASATPHVMTVFGEAGIGKSRLASEFEARARGTAFVLAAACVPPGEGPPLGPFDQILDAISELPLAGAETREQLASMERVSVGLDSSPPPRTVMPPRQLRYETEHAWRRLLTSLAEERAVVVILEDLHWADRSLLDLLEALADRLDGPVLFVCLARPELVEQGEGWGAGRPNHTTMELEPLTEPDAARLVMSLLGPDPPGLPFLADLVAAAEGNPFFLEELVRGLADRGVLEATGTGWRAASTPVRIDVPDTVQAVLATRIDALEPADKAVLHAASVLGRDVPVDAVAWALPGEPVEVRRSLDRLVARGLMEPGEDDTGAERTGRSYRFRHALTRDVAYAAVSRRIRCLLHDRAADWVEQHGGDARRRVSEAVAHHRVAAWLDTQAAGAAGTERAARRSMAFRASLLASEASRAGAAAAIAAEHARRAISLAADDQERSAALEGLGRAQLGGYSPDEAWASLAAALELRLADRPCDGVTGPDPALAGLAAYALEAPTRWGMTRPPEPGIAERYLAVGLAAAGAGDSDERVRLLAAQALLPIALAQGPQAAVLEASRATAQEAAEMAERLDRPELASAALDAVCLFLYNLGRYGEMRGFVERRLALIPALTDVGEIQDSYAMAAWCAFHLGEYPAARAFADRGIAQVKEVDPALGIHSRIWRSVAALRSGDWDTVLVDQVDLARLAGPAPTGGRGSLPTLAAALVHDRRGERASADELIRSVGRDAASAGDASPAHDDAASEPERDVPWLARLLSERGLHDRALRLLRVPIRLEHRENLGLILEARCDAIGDAEAWQLAPAAISAAHAYAAEIASVALSAHADRLAGRAQAARRDLITARAKLERGARGFERCGDPYLTALATLELADVLAGAGAPTDATERAVEAAYRSLDRLGAGRARDRAGAFLERLGADVPLSGRGG